MAEPSQQQVADLVALAQARFGELSQAELKLLRAAPKGEVAWCGPSANNDPANDPAKAEEWGHEREIRADLIRWLCIDRDVASAVDPKGIQVHAARVTGPLDLSFVSVPFRLLLRHCSFADSADLTSTGLPALDLAGTRVQSVVGDRIHVGGDVFLNNGFTAEGEVSVLEAEVGGTLECTGGTFKNPGKDALSADGANLSGGVFLDDGFCAEGTVRLLGAQIGGNLECGGGRFKNVGRTALYADGTNVKGDVFLTDGLNVEGAVLLLGAQIGGNLQCSSGRLKNPDGDALSADGANVKGDVFLTDGLSAEGTVRLHGAQIGGDFDCSGGTFKNPGKKALSADRADIKGSLFLCDGFSAEGAVRLRGVQVDGNLDCRGARLSELVAENAAVRRTLFWRGIVAAEATRLNLTNASASSLVDDEKSWPAKGNLLLDGFVYGQISGESPRDAKTRLRWLERQEPFRPKPYRQLAKVLGEAGDDSGARKVLFEMERWRRKDEDLRRREETKNRQFRLLHFPRLRALATTGFRVYSHLWRQCARLWGWLLEWTIGYGFHPGWAFYWLLGLGLVGSALFWYGYSVRAMAPTDKDAYHFFRDHGSSPDHYPRFTASIYSLENSLPFVNLGQKDNWRPDPNPRASPRLSTFLRGFHRVQILLGWLLATLFVAGVTGVVRKE
jgi:hypothetical protein